MYKKFNSSHWFLKIQIFSLFPIVKMKPSDAEICMVDNFEPDFQHVPHVQFLRNFHNIVVKHYSFKFSKE